MSLSLLFISISMALFVFFAFLRRIGHVRLDLFEHLSFSLCLSGIVTGLAYIIGSYS